MSQVSKSFFWIENPWNIKDVICKKHVCTYFELLLTPSTYIAFDQLFIFNNIFDSFNIKVITWTLILY